MAGEVRRRPHQTPCVAREAHPLAVPIEDDEVVMFAVIATDAGKKSQSRVGGPNSVTLGPAF